MSELVLTKSDIHTLASEYEHKRPEEILRAAMERISNLALACSFGAEDMVLVDMLMKINPDAKVFYLDTDVLFKETYELRDRAIAKYGLKNLIQVRSLLSLEEQKEQLGDQLWATNPNQCCDIRKVTPLTNVLSTLEGWITGIRRDQAPTRANSQVFEEDMKFGLIKVNPLALWTNEQVWDYIREHDVPYNVLHDNGYPSIGCIHCTKPVKAGEDPRSGRWAGFEKTECGLHK